MLRNSASVPMKEPTGDAESAAIRRTDEFRLPFGRRSAGGRADGRCEGDADVQARAAARGLDHQCTAERGDTLSEDRRTDVETGELSQVVATGEREAFAVVANDHGH